MTNSLNAKVRVFTPHNILALFEKYSTFWLDAGTVYVNADCPGGYYGSLEFEREAETIADTLDMLSISGLLIKSLPLDSRNQSVYQWRDWVNE